MRKQHLTPYSGSLFRLALTLMAAVAVIAVAFVAVEKSAPALRQGSASYEAPAPRDGAMALTAAERQFLLRAAELNADEIRLSELARQRAEDAGVRLFAAEIQAGRRAADAELAALAQRKGVRLAAEEFDRAAVEKLAAQAGRNFDEAYLEKIVEKHGDAADLFERAALQCDDAELKAYAIRALPALQAHRAQARQRLKTAG